MYSLKYVPDIRLNTNKEDCDFLISPFNIGLF